MPDWNDLIRQLQQNAPTPKTADQLQNIMQSSEARRMAQTLSSQNADTLEKAAQAVQNGNRAEAARLAQQLMQTPEGASLVKHLRDIFGK